MIQGELLGDAWGGEQPHDAAEHNSQQSGQS